MTLDCCDSATITGKMQNAKITIRCADQFNEDSRSLIRSLISILYQDPSAKRVSLEPRSR